MDYKYEDFCDTTVEALPEDAPLCDKVALLEKQVADLQVLLRDLEVTFKSLGGNFDIFVRSRIDQLSDKLAQELVNKCADRFCDINELPAALEKVGVHAEIRQAVEKVFLREADEM